MFEKVTEISCREYRALLSVFWREPSYDPARFSTSSPTILFLRFVENISCNLYGDNISAPLWFMKRINHWRCIRPLPGTRLSVCTVYDSLLYRSGGYKNGRCFCAFGRSRFSPQSTEFIRSISLYNTLSSDWVTVSPISNTNFHTTSLRWRSLLLYPKLHRLSTIIIMPQ